MKIPLSVSFLLSSLASGAIVPAPSNRDTSTRNIISVAGTTGSDHVSINFRAPCQGCFIGTDDGLDLTLEIDTAEEECGTSPPRLNGQPLAVTDSTDISRGNLSFKSQPANGLGEKEVYATWESTCLNGEASILTVHFHGVAGHNQASGASGFTTSFKQKGQPQVLRLQDRPLEELVAENICKEWLVPSDLSVIPPASNPNAAFESLLQAEYLKLDRLKDQMGELHESVRETEAKIMSLLKAEFKACTTMKCLWQTAINKAPLLTKLITVHFSHHKHNASGCKNGDGQSPCAFDEVVISSDDAVSGVTDASDVAEDVQFDELSAPETMTTSLIATRSPTPTVFTPVSASSSTSSDAEASSLAPDFTPTSTSELTHETSAPSYPPEENHAPPAEPPFDGPDHQPFHPHGPPPGFPHPPGHHGPPPWAYGPPGENGPPGFPGHHGRPPWSFGRPDQEPEHHRPEGHEHPGLAPFWQGGAQRVDFRLTLAVLCLLFVVVLSGCVFYCIRVRAFFRDPRRRAERAARREERAKRRQYRKAACRHRWRTWWKGFNNQSSSDYEEKRELILEQGGLMVDVVQNEIRNLRGASTLVRDLVRAEEGRSRRVGQRNTSTPYSRDLPRAELEAGEGSSRIRDLPPSYIAPPPRYEEELEGDMMVVDGFQYSASTSDDMTESSIVDCTPRLSFETGRSTILTEKGRD